MSTSNVTGIEEIIQRNARTPEQDTFRPFGEDDWMLYAGVETQTPEIAETKCGSIVLDGETVGVHRVTEEDFVSFQSRFPTKAVARLVAEHLLSLDNPSEATIAEYLESI